LEQALASGEGVALEKRYLRPDGTVVWAASSLTPLHVSADYPKSVLVVTTDLSARKHAELALRASEERFRAIVSQATAGIGYADMEGRLTFVNERLTEIVGCGPRGLVGRTMRDLIQLDDEAESSHRLERTMKEGIPFQLEQRLVRGDGAIVWVNATVSAIRDPAQNVRSVATVIIDITDRKEAEEALRASQERLRLIVENAREYAIFSLDLTRQITSWNSGAQAILGYASEEAIGQSADILFTPEDTAAAIPAAEAATALREGSASEERWHVRKDGSRFWASGVLMAMHDGSGNAVGLVKIFRDRTEDLRSREALERYQDEIWEALQETERARAEAEAAGKAKDHFMAVLSHELRTPLTPVLMAVRILSRDKGLTDSMREVLSMIQRNVQLEVKLVDELLDLTRIGLGKMELFAEPIDLHEVLSSVEEVVRGDVEAKRQQLTIELQAQEHMLTGDRKRLQQVFWNLLRNASKFTPEGGSIALRSRQLMSTENPSTSRIVVEVSDNGIGLEADAVERIFDAFAQADESVAREFGGLGLGLAIAKAVVDAHGGTVRATSAGRGEGTTCIVELPLHPEHGV
ncbi:MAG TPA: PAS domain S-box protein, partial [Chthoniobacteraceae bacterium]